MYIDEQVWSSTNSSQFDLMKTLNTTWVCAMPTRRTRPYLFATSTNLDKWVKLKRERLNGGKVGWINTKGEWGVYSIKDINFFSFV